MCPYLEVRITEALRMSECLCFALQHHPSFLLKVSSEAPFVSSASSTVGRIGWTVNQGVLPITQPRGGPRTQDCSQNLSLKRSHVKTVAGRARLTHRGLAGIMLGFPVPWILGFLFFLRCGLCISVFPLIWKLPHISPMNFTA